MKEFVLKCPQCGTEITSDNPDIYKNYRACSACGYQFVEGDNRDEVKASNSAAIPAANDCQQNEDYSVPVVCKLLLIAAIAVAVFGVLAAFAASSTSGWTSYEDDVIESENYFAWGGFFWGLIMTVTASTLLLGFRQMILLRVQRNREAMQLRKLLEERL